MGTCASFRRLGPSSSWASGVKWDSICSVADIHAVVTDAPASIEGGRRFDLGEATWLEQLATFVQKPKKPRRTR